MQNRSHVYAFNCSFDDHKHRRSKRSSVCGVAAFQLEDGPSCDSPESTEPAWIAEGGFPHQEDGIADAE
jgi:hypothetical protein